MLQVAIKMNDVVSRNVEPDFHLNFSFPARLFSAKMINFFCKSVETLKSRTSLKSSDGIMRFLSLSWPDVTGKEH